MPLECLRHWEVTRELQRELAILKETNKQLPELAHIVRTIEQHVALQSGALPRLSDEIARIGKSISEEDTRQRGLETHMAGLQARVTLAIGLLVPIACALIVAIIQGHL